jgi:hypothetical protein
MAQPAHGAVEARFVAAFRGQVEQIVGAEDDIQSASETGIGVIDVPFRVLSKNAGSGSFFRTKSANAVVVVHLLGGHVLRAERHLVVIVKVAA